MEKDHCVIDREFLIKMKISPDAAVKYIESKKANTLDPVHIIAHQILKKKPTVASNS